MGSRATKCVCIPTPTSYKFNEPRPCEANSSRNQEVGESSALSESQHEEVTRERYESLVEEGVKTLKGVTLKGTPEEGCSKRFPETKMIQEALKTRRDRLTKRGPERTKFSSGDDKEISEALSTNSFYIRLREQVALLMEQRSRHTGEASIASWTEQIKFTQQLAIAALVEDFGRARAGSHIKNMRTYWREQEAILQNQSVKTALDRKFFEYFDVDNTGVIDIKDFRVIAELIDPKLAKDHATVDRTFMFLDRSHRNSFNFYDFKEFMAQHWAGKINAFQHAVINYLNDTPKMSISEIHFYITGEVAEREHKRSLDDHKAGPALSIQDSGSDTSSNYSYYNPQAIVEKMRKLRKEMERKSSDFEIGLHGEPDIAFDVMDVVYFSDSEVDTCCTAATEEHATISRSFSHCEELSYSAESSLLM